MKLLVFGGSGMLGSEVVAQAVARGHEVTAPSHLECKIDDPNSTAVWCASVPLRRLTPRAYRAKPDVIINCAGMRPTNAYRAMINANVHGPWNIANSVPDGCRFIHMSTDCVFSGLKARGGYSSADLPDPETLYGRTKLAGEPLDELSAPYTLVVRGSFIGPRHGLLRWLLDARVKVDAWTRAWWNGGSVYSMAGALLDLAEGDQVGIVHVASPESMSKAFMIAQLVGGLGLQLDLELCREPFINHTLLPDVELPPVSNMLDDLIERARAGWPPIPVSP